MNFFDPDLLRTFLAFVDSGSLARAAVMVGRSPSAVTAQMQRLEEAVGEALLEPSGRGRALTSAGEDLAGHARRILDAHRQAMLSLRGAHADGRLALGATQDFAASGLPALLRLFAATHPRLRFELRIGRSQELRAALESGELDVVIVMRQGASPDEVGIISEPMTWLSSRHGLVVPSQEIPLALLDAPCEFRNAALAALDAAGRPYRIAATSQSLAGLHTAVGAGLAVTLRTPRWAGPDIAETGDALGLPAVGDATFSIHLRAEAPPSARSLATLLSEGLASAG